MRERILVVLACAFAAGCGDDFAPQSEIHGLRVLAVRPEPASGSPGATIGLDMLVADQRPWQENDAGVLVPPAVDIVWLGGCHNPPGRQYFACGPAISAVASKPVEATAAGLIGGGSHYDLAIPDDILSSAPLIAHDALHFGVSYVFFAACTGTIVPASGPTESGLPLACEDENGAAVGNSGFVLGFSTIYTYEGDENQNQNPALSGLTFGGEAAPAASVDGFGDMMDGSSAQACASDEECANDELEHERRCSAHGTCAPVVTGCEDDAKSCKAYRVLPELATGPESFTGGNEIAWASYYATAGKFGSENRLVVDRANGLARDIGDGWRPPPSPADGKPITSRLWVTVNDQRGGATWAFFDVIVE